MDSAPTRLEGTGVGISDTEERLRFIEEGQRHCDHFLTPIADPAGKSVLVAGCGAGTEMLWCLRRGAKEVVGVDILEQDPAALELARKRHGIDDSKVARMRRLEVSELDSLGRRFDLVVSNNVFEHVADVAGGLAACARAVDPERGRIAVFSDPLFYSSCGSHLEHEPWEHLWANPDELRERLLARARSTHPALARLDLQDFFDREITLNRLRFVDYVEAIRRSQLVALRLEPILDRNLSRFSEYEPAIRAKCDPGLTTLDFTIEGFSIVLALPGADPGPVDPLRSRPRRRGAWLRRLRGHLRG